jgi:hypothetical protein
MGSPFLPQPFKSNRKLISKKSGFKDYPIIPFRVFFSAVSADLRPVILRFRQSHSFGKGNEPGSDE